MTDHNPLDPKTAENGTPTTPDPETATAENVTPTTAGNDDFMMRLAAANPVAGWDLPSAQDPSAQKILETAMNQHTPQQTTPQDTGSNESYTDHYQRTHVPLAEYQAPAGAESVAPAPPIQPLGAEALPARPRRTRSRGMLVGAAAAVLLLFGGLLVFSPDTTPSAVATVRSAAAAAADADTGRIETTFSASGTDGTEAGSVSGSFEAYYSGSDIAFTVNVDAIEGVDELGEIPVSEVRLIDDVVYINGDGQWMAIDTDGLLGQMVTDFVDPRSVLETVQEITEATEIGSATVDGVETTQYQSVIDLADESLTESGWLGFEGAGLDAEGEITVDLYVDDNGLLRQLDIGGDLRDTADAGENGTFTVTTRFFDVGSDITVEAPENVEVFDPLQGLLGE
ncbi:MAG: hypothetical protein AAGA65_29515 [Actinomycetota bacterium]